MKIKLKGRIGGPRGMRGGDIVDYPEDQAKRLIDRGYADPVVEDTPVRHAKVETTQAPRASEKRKK